MNPKVVFLEFVAQGLVSNYSVGTCLVMLKMVLPEVFFQQMTSPDCKVRTLRSLFPEGAL